MNLRDWVNIVIYLLSAAVMFGFMRAQLGDIAADVTSIKATLAVVKTSTDQQQVLNTVTKEDIETINDRLDVHDLALKNIELEQARQRGVNNNG